MSRLTSWQWLAMVSTGLALMIAVWIGSLVSQPDWGASPSMSRSVTTVAMLSVPALIGAFGAWSGRRVLVVSAATVALLQSLVAFSGVTIPFLIPSLLWFRAAITMPDTGHGRTELRPIRLLLIAVVAVPLTLALLYATGLLGLLLLVALAVLVARKQSGPRVARREALIGAVVVVLGVAALVSTIAADGWARLLVLGLFALAILAVGRLARPESSTSRSGL
jgi:hypothetical protein